MGKSIIKTIVVFSSIFLLTLSAFATEVDIATENLKYTGADGKIIARDDVVLNWKDKKIYADMVELDIKTKTMNAYGNVKFEDSENIIRANTVSYDYNDETGDIDEAFAYSSSVFMRCESMEKIDKDRFTLHNVKLSVCDLDKPHTYLKAKRGELIVDKSITVHKATLYVGKMPIFYVPVYTQSLEKGKKNFVSNLKYGFFPGFTESYHPTFEAFVACSLTENIYGKLKLYHSDKKCTGGGVEINYQTDDDNLRINLDTCLSSNNNRKNWQVKPNYSHKLNNQWTLRSSLNAQNHDSYEEFIKKYHDSIDSSANLINARNHEEFIKKYRDSTDSSASANLTRQGSSTNLSIDLACNAGYDRESLRYKTSSAKLPKVTFSIYGKDIGLGIIHTPKWEYEHDYALSDGNQNAKKKCCFSDKILLEHKFTTSLKILKGLSLKPGLEADANFYSKDKAGNYKGGCYMHYGGSLAPNYKPTDWMNWRATYKYKARTKQRSFAGAKYKDFFVKDTGGEDSGIEANGCMFTNAMEFDNDISVENTIDYSWLNSRSKKERLSPLKTELEWKPKDFFISSLKVGENHYLHPSFKFKDFELKAQIGNMEEKYLNFGFNLKKRTLDIKNKHAFGVESTFGFGGWINPKWRIDYKVSIDFSDKEKDKITDRITRHELKIYRDMHCWECSIVLKKPTTSFIYSSKPNFVAFNFNLKTNIPFFNKSEDASGAEDSQEVFYPWHDEQMQESFFDF
jgi:LPS-assembly protein